MNQELERLVRFKLFPSRRSNIIFCPCLIVQLDNGLEVVRILDPELGEAFVSVAPMFIAANVSLLDGLVEFNLRKPGYDISLGNLAPFDDFWVSLPTARDIASALGFAEKLSGLLDRKSRLAWSLDDGEEGGMLHNWMISKDAVKPGGYSTDAMLNTPFANIIMLQKGAQIRTPLDRTSLQPTLIPTDTFFIEDRSRLLSLLVSWTSILYEEWLDKQGEDPATHAPEPVTAEEEVDTRFLYRLLVSAGITAPTLSLTPEDIVGDRGLRLAGDALTFEGPQDIDAHSVQARLAFVDLLTRVVMGNRMDIPDAHSHNTEDRAEADLQAREKPTALEKLAGDQVNGSPSSGVPHNATEALQNSLDQMHLRLAALEAVSLLSPASRSKPETTTARPPSLTQLELVAKLSPTTIAFLLLLSYVSISAAVGSLHSVVAWLTPALQRYGIVHAN